MTDLEHPRGSPKNFANPAYAAGYEDATQSMTAEMLRARGAGFPEPPVTRILRMLEARRNYWRKAYQADPSLSNILMARHEISRAIVAICQEFGQPIPAWWGHRDGDSPVQGFEFEEPPHA